MPKFEVEVTQHRAEYTTMVIDAPDEASAKRGALRLVETGNEPDEWNSGDVVEDSAVTSACTQLRGT